MYWELWDVESRNLVEDFATEEEALQAIREILAVNRPDYVDFLALAAMYDEGESREAELPPALSGDALRSRLAEHVPKSAVDETAHAVHERIRRWLAEEGWDIQEVDNAQSALNIMVTLQNQQKINIYQLKDHFDHVTLHVHLTFSGNDLDEISKMSDSIRQEIAWNIFRDTSIMGIDFLSPGIQLSEMRFLAYAYFDSLTKDLLIQRILLVLRAVSLSVRTIARGLDEAGRPAEATSSLLRLITRQSDGTGLGGGLPVAS